MRQKIVFLLVIALLLPGTFLPVTIKGQEKNQQDKSKSNKTEQREDPDEEDDADLPEMARGKISKADYLRAREEHIKLLRGIPYPRLEVRNEAIYQTMRQEIALRNQRIADGASLVDPVWRYLGPSPIPVSPLPTSGRVTSIAVHPTNPDIAYVGAAQGGLYRTLDGGATWTPLMDNALTLAIGSIAISPSSPSTIFVGTGESSLSGDSFFGVGVYRITNADTTPVLSSPIGSAEFNGRSVSKIIVHPTDPNTIFVSSATGTCGMGGCTGQPTPSLGIYRSNNALAASPTFTKLNVTAANGGNRAVMDMVIEPDNPNNMVCWVRGNAGAGDGGIYRSTNALSATPTFTQTYIMVTNGSRGELALQKSGSTVTIFAATGEVAGGATQGSIFKSVDGGLTWNQFTSGNNFCNPQCFYDIAIEIDPTNANNVYLGGSPQAVFRRSTDGGTTFASSSAGLHVDTHSIVVAPSNPQIIYFGSDGGIYRSTNGGTTWNSLNNATFAATQFQAIALHPTDRNYMLGGTQDNGTLHLAPNGTTWVTSRGGDGGYALIDTNATNTTTLTAYHTFFNRTNSQIGFERSTTTTTNGNPVWGGFLGCTGTTSNNGIGCGDTTLFYAPMALGPGNPNTIYFGTNFLYRSGNTGTTMTAVSQALGTTISTISVSPQNDNVRLVGTTSGALFATSNGSTTLNTVTGTGMPTRFVGRVMIDPNNSAVAYAAFGGYGVAAGSHVWKTTNLTSATPTWTPAGNGIPDVPVNALAVDPRNSNNVYAGTDIGVFRSTDGGANWTSFGTGLPRVAVFDMAIHRNFPVLRIGTHGRGIWEIDLNAPTRATAADFDGDSKTDFSVFRPTERNWYALRSSNNSFSAVQFGLSTDKTVPADYDGDGKTDIAVYRDGIWFILQSTTGSPRVQQFGISTDVPVPADYDGDNKADLAVYRGGLWYVLRSSDNVSTVTQWGAASDLTVPGDYDGDGKFDLGVYRPTEGNWYVLQSSGGFLIRNFGLNGDKPTAADYDGDGKYDMAVFRPTDRNWYLLQSTGGFRAIQFGNSTDVPSQGDYTGDGKADIAVYRPTEGNWYVMNLVNNTFIIVNFGTNGDVSIPARYNPLQ